MKTHGLLLFLALLSPYGDIQVLGLRNAVGRSVYYMVWKKRFKDIRYGTRMVQRTSVALRSYEGVER